MARFISRTIWRESGAPLELIAFPRCCVGVIGCSKAALGSDSWAEVGQQQLAWPPSPAACQVAVKHAPSILREHALMLACTRACARRQASEWTSGKAWGRERGRERLPSIRLNIWARRNRWQISSSAWNDTPCQLAAYDLPYIQIVFGGNHSETILAATFSTLGININIQKSFYS